MVWKIHIVFTTKNITNETCTIKLQTQLTNMYFKVVRSSGSSAPTSVLVAMTSVAMGVKKSQITVDLVLSM